MTDETPTPTPAPHPEVAEANAILGAIVPSLAGHTVGAAFRAALTLYVDTAIQMHLRESDISRLARDEYRRRRK